MKCEGRLPVAAKNGFMGARESRDRWDDLVLAACKILASRQQEQCTFLQAVTARLGQVTLF